VLWRLFGHCLEVGRSVRTPLHKNGQTKVEMFQIEVVDLEKTYSLRYVPVLLCNEPFSKNIPKWGSHWTKIQFNRQFLMCIPFSGFGNETYGQFLLIKGA
jgi:hypothetical protein